MNLPRLAPVVLVLCSLLMVAGCGSSPSQSRQRTFSVYSLLDQPGSGAGKEFVRGEKLALSEAEGMAGSVVINFVSVDETETGAVGRREAAGEGARRVIADPQAVAAIGGVDRSTSEVTASLLNGAGILLVSPTRSAAAGHGTAETSGQTKLLHVHAEELPKGFAKRFKAEFGESPGLNAVSGYIAMQRVLAAVKATGDSTNRESVSAKALQPVS